MSGEFRLAGRGRVDATQPLRFVFNGTRLTGLHGDTLASALLANGVRVVARSFKFHRPRGIFSAGVEEPNAIVAVGEGDRLEPNVRATMQPLYDGLIARSQNVWPSVDFDIGRVNDFAHALLPAGFYNKTFMWPSWRWYEPAVRRAAGRGPALTLPDPDRYETRNATFDVIVVGGGISGLEAALDAADNGASVLLVEQDTELGGYAFTCRIDPRALVTRVRDHSHITTLLRATAAGVYDHGTLAIVQRLRSDHIEDAACRERFWCVRASQITLATGAIEQPLVFAGNDLPGVMLASGVRAYLNRYGVRSGRRVVVATIDDSAYDCAADLSAAGVEVVALLDLRSEVSAEHSALMRAARVPLVTDARIERASGGRGISVVEYRDSGGNRKRLSCDLLAVSGGWSPSLHLFSQARGKLRFDVDRDCLVPHELPRGMRVVGAAAGELHAGRGAGESPAISQVSRRARAWVDLAHDVTVSDLDLAIAENFVSVEHLKRYTTTGMSVDQGKTSSVNALRILAASTGRAVDDVGTTTFRPPFSPVTFGALSGGRVGEFFRPVRELPSHEAQAPLGARFEESAGWARPVAYPSIGESEQAAVSREISAVRNQVGIYEGSALGKILVRGPDAATFLDRIYAMDVGSLQVGRVRYGLMLNEHGFILDDGVCVRLEPNSFWVGTTSAGAVRIADWLETWLQCEWPQLQVAISVVTAQWATIAVAGPRSRELLQRLALGVDLSPALFPHMQVRDGRYLGDPCRIMRVSFSGEVAFEVSVPSGYGLTLWEALMEAGRDLGVAPYGTEALQALRTEKGFIHVGSDTDGTTVPDDVGFGAMVRKKAGDFLGRRSLTLAEHVRPDRLQLVGILPENPREKIACGAHVVSGGQTTRRCSEGYVTSAYFSPTLGHFVSLALVKSGRARHGETIRLFNENSEQAARIVKPVFYDPDGGRMRG